MPVILAAFDPFTCFRTRKQFHPKNRFIINYILLYSPRATPPFRRSEPKNFCPISRRTLVRAYDVRKHPSLFLFLKLHWHYVSSDHGPNQVTERAENADLTASSTRFESAAPRPRECSPHLSTVNAPPTFPGENAGTTQVTAHPQNLRNHSSDNRRAQLGSRCPINRSSLHPRRIRPETPQKHAFERTKRTYL